MYTLHLPSRKGGNTDRLMDTAASNVTNSHLQFCTIWELFFMCRATIIVCSGILITNPFSSTFVFAVSDNLGCVQSCEAIQTVSE
jgi:hypothetical protein